MDDVFLIGEVWPGISTYAKPLFPLHEAAAAMGVDPATAMAFLDENFDDPELICFVGEFNEETEEDEPQPYCTASGLAALYYAEQEEAEAEIRKEFGVDPVAVLSPDEEADEQWWRHGRRPSKIWQEIYDLFGSITVNRPAQ